MIFTTDCISVEHVQISGDKITSITDLSNFIPKTITKSGEVIIDEDERKCLVSKNKFRLNLQTSKSLPIGISLNHNEWELLAYEEGGFFNKHTDRKRSLHHKYTALLYLPSSYTGGEMIIYGDYHQINFIFENIDKPVLLIFDINMPHESLPVTSGIKFLFKTAVSFYDGHDDKIQKDLIPLIIHNQTIISRDALDEDDLDEWRRKNRENGTDDLED